MAYNGSMSSSTNQKVTVSLPPDALAYAERYQKEHGLATRSEVLALALRLLRERELEAGYRALSQDYLKETDPLLDSGLEETLEAMEQG